MREHTLKPSPGESESENETDDDKEDDEDDEGDDEGDVGHVRINEVCMYRSEDECTTHDCTAQALGRGVH